MSDEESALNSAPAAGASSAGAPVPGPSTATDAEAPLSKKAQKRLAKRAKHEATKLEKRAAERVRRRERAQYLSQGYAAGTLSAEDASLFEKQREQKRARKAASRGADAGDVWPGAVVVDLGFDDLMTEQEITSMHSQLGYVYSHNRTAKRPFAAVVHTSFAPETSPRLWTKMGKAQWQRWNRMWFMKEDVGELAKQLGKMDVDESADEVTRTEPAPQAAAPEDTAASSSTPSGSSVPYAELVRHIAPTMPSVIPPTHKLVYLSADADEELTTLAPDEVYVIGGIVDRNRHKMLCQNKAEGLGIRTARLPIGTYLANLPTRKVLTVNQVFEILSQYLALQDWAAAFEAVIPQRKYFVGKEAKKQSNKTGGAKGEDEGDENEGEESEGSDGDGSEEGDKVSSRADAVAEVAEEEALNS